MQRLRGWGFWCVTKPSNVMIVSSSQVQAQRSHKWDTQGMQPHIVPVTRNTFNKVQVWAKGFCTRIWRPEALCNNANAASTISCVKGIQAYTSSHVLTIKTGSLNTQTQMHVCTPFKTQVTSQFNSRNLLGQSLGVWWGRILGYWGVISVCYLSLPITVCW